MQTEENFQNKGNETGKKSKLCEQLCERDIYIYIERERERESISYRVRQKFEFGGHSTCLKSKESTHLHLAVLKWPNSI